MMDKLSARGCLTIALIIALTGFIAAGMSGIILDLLVELIKNI